MFPRRPDRTDDPRRHQRAALFAVVAALLCAGCSDFREKWDAFFKPRVEEAPPRPVQTPTAALAGTIGELTALSGMGGLQVRGIGLVIGLGDRGTTQVSGPVREYLIDELTKQVRVQLDRKSREAFSPQKMIDSPDTAVVEVFGVIPAGATKGAAFDVSVVAYPGTQTTSLEGGVLWPCELRIVDVSYKGDKLLAGRAVARAAGPIFTNPFAAGAAPTVTDPRRGTVLGGGRTSEPRNMRMVLANASYVTARQIEQRINERFGNSPKIAEAMSQSYVEVRTPDAYADDPVHFARLASHLYLRNDGALLERRLGDLHAVAERDDTALENVSLAWEGMGRLAIPRIQPLYTSDRPDVAYHAARAGLRLGDAAALEVMIRIAGEPRHAFRQSAVRELGHCQFPQACTAIIPLLGETNQELRIIAYEALLQQRHPAVDSTRVPHVLDPQQTNFWLDQIDAAGDPFIYVRRSGTPRIALFGSRAACRLPLFYAHPDGSVTLNGREPDGDVTLFCRTRKSQRLSDPLTAPPRVADLVLAMAEPPVKDDAGRTRGLGLGYSQVLQVLDALSHDDAIAARLVIEQKSMTELLGPDLSPDRPEADAPAERTADSGASGDAPPPEPQTAASGGR
ncbi:MAG: Flagellar P-ring protein [Phycisphaerae bacterium]|nr:Flagellar P-ring protein [Phycisphaerae bacterium]